VGDDAWRPLDGVDLGQQGSVNQSRAIEYVVVRPGWKLRRQTIADGVVLEREQVVQQAQADPVVTVDAGQIDALVVLRQEAVGGDLELAALARAQLHEHVLAAAIQL
jgi:hypothetical protein